uniref:Helix-turn-helix DNA binding domain protein n=1 Tax=Gordonia phage Petito TaxID=3158876 RepID=A0AAU8GQI3_9CAUD
MVADHAHMPMDLVSETDRSDPKLFEQNKISLRLAVPCLCGHEAFVQTTVARDTIIENLGSEIMQSLVECVMSLHMIHEKQRRGGV